MLGRLPPISLLGAKMELSSVELQQLVFLVGSKKAFANYLGLDQKAAGELWDRNGLVTPVQYVRSLTREVLNGLVAKYGSVRGMARYFGLSAAALRAALKGPVEEVSLRELTVEKVSEVVSRCKSIRLAHRVLREGGYEVSSEAYLRKMMEDAGLDLASLLDWSFSNHANAKGRRAELEFDRIRGDNILEDCNKTQGSQADTDFVDREWGRVNVKSSRLYRMKAKTRKADPYYGKFSTSAIFNSDFVALMLYDQTGRVFVGMKILEPQQMGRGKSFTISAKEFK